MQFLYEDSFREERLNSIKKKKEEEEEGKGKEEKKASFQSERLDSPRG